MPKSKSFFKWKDLHAYTFLSLNIMFVNTERVQVIAMLRYGRAIMHLIDEDMDYPLKVFLLTFHCLSLNTKPY